MTGQVDGNIIAALISAGVVIVITLLGVAAQIGGLRQRVKDMADDIRDLKDWIQGFVRPGGRRRMDPP